MIFQPGDDYCGLFVTSSPSTHAAVDADSLPVATVTRNGVDDGDVSPTVANIDTGRYKVTFTIPVTYAIGDVVHVSVAATVATIDAKGIVDAIVLRLATPSLISPIQGTAASSVGVHQDVEVQQGSSAPAVVVSVVDGEGAAVDCSAKTLRLNVGLTATSPPLFTLTSGGGGLTVGGDDDNEVTATYTTTHTATAGAYRWWLWDVTSPDLVLAYGSWSILAARKAVAS